MSTSLQKSTWCLAAAFAAAALLTAPSPASAEEASQASAGATTAARSICGVADPASLTAAPVAPTRRTVAIDQNQVDGLSSVGGHLTVQIANRISHLDASGQVTDAFSMPNVPYSPGVAADEQGNSYVVEYPNKIDKFSPTGTLIWQRTFNNPLARIFSRGTGAAMRIGAGAQDAGQDGHLLSLDGADLGTVSVARGEFSPDGEGMLISGDGRIRSYDATGALTRALGNDAATMDPMPTGGVFHFSGLGDAIPFDGGILATDTRYGLIKLNAAGGIESHIDPGSLNGLSDRSVLALHAGRVYYGSGQPWNRMADQLSSISVADVRTLLGAHKAPFSWLGVGAGLTLRGAGLHQDPGQVPERGSVGQSGPQQGAGQVGPEVAVIGQGGRDDLAFDGAPLHKFATKFQHTL